MNPAAKFKIKLPPEGNFKISYVYFHPPFSVNRILYVRNLPYKITTEELYDIFGKFGALRQVRIGVTAETKGTAYVIYEVRKSIIEKTANICLRTFMMPRTHAIICPASTSATGTWSFCTTIQLERSRNWRRRRKKQSWQR